MKLHGHGIGVDLPSRWEAVISRAEEPANAGAGRRAATSAGAPATYPTAHLANRPLPPTRGDFGSGLVEHLAADEAFVALVEFGPECVDTALFAAQGIPRHLSPADLRPSQLQRTIAGQAGFQRFCSEAGRAFCLYVVVGSHQGLGLVLPEVRLVLRGLTVDPA